MRIFYSAFFHFNLFIHDSINIEIADMLNISINTSKSQLILAKDRLRKELEKVNRY